MTPKPQPSICPFSFHSETTYSLLRQVVESMKTNMCSQVTAFCNWAQKPEHDDHSLPFTMSKATHPRSDKWHSQNIFNKRIDRLNIWAKIKTSAPSFLGRTSGSLDLRRQTRLLFQRSTGLQKFNFNKNGWILWCSIGDDAFSITEHFSLSTWVCGDWKLNTLYLTPYVFLPYVLPLATLL